MKAKKVEMKGPRFLLLAGALVLAALLVSSIVLAQGVTGPQIPQNVTDDLGTGFTYQGQLKKGDSPVDGACDMAFRLYDAAEGGGQVGSAITRPVTITAGLFVETLDFGSGAFTGDGRWLDIKVRCTGEGDTEYADLGRQQLTAAPYALYALGAPWSGLSNVPPGFADGVDDVSAVVSGTNIFAGDGLTQASSGNAITLSVDFAGSGGDYGAATSVARSDHTHDGRYYTESELQTGSSASVHWGNLTNVPDGLDDGDDVITYTAGTGLALNGAEFSITPTYRLPQACGNGQIAEWNDTASQWECGDDDTGAGGDYWSLTGNAGTTPATHFLGTTDDVSLTLAVNGSPALRLEPDATSPNLIGGHVSNTVNAGVYGAVIGGGGNSTSPNYVIGNYGTVGGGLSNWAGLAGSPSDTLYATVGGGYGNIVGAEGATIGGGAGNAASSDYATVPGGFWNAAHGDYAFAAGQRAKANHDGAFVWADSTDADLYSSSDNQFLVRATGGVNFQTGSANFQINDRNVWQPANVIMVAQSGGDYTSVQAAVDSIGDAAADNPYLVWVAPGVYSETVTMKPYVHLQGAGQEATVITSTATTGDWPPTTATLMLADHVSLRNLTVGNNGTGYRNVALLAMDGTTQTLVADVTAQAQGEGGISNYAIFLTGSGTGITLQHVTGLSENGSENYGLYNQSGAAATLRGGSFTGRGGNNARGIYNEDSNTTLEAESVTALGENASNSNTGLVNGSSADATLRGGSFTGRGGNSTYGILNSNAMLGIEGAIVLAETGSSSYGLYNSVGASAMLHGGSFTARGGSSAYGVYNKDSSTKLEAEGVTGLGENAGSSNVGLYNSSSATATLHGGAFTGRGGSYTRGIYNSTTLRAESVTGLGENGDTNNFGLYNEGAGAATLRGGSFTGRGDGDARGIYNRYSGTTLEAENVTALGENGSDNYGLYNSDVATATLRGGSFTGRGGTNAYGIYNDDSGTMLEADSVTALGKNGSTFNYGLYNDDSAAATLRDGSFTGRGGSNAYGIYNDGSGTTLEAESLTALAENGTSDNYGLYNFYGTTALYGGSFIGRGGNTTRGIVNYGSGATLEAERLTVLAENGSANNYGLHNSSGAATLRGGSCTGRGGVAYGIYNQSSGATLKAESLTALGENGGTNYGLRITAGTATVTQGVLEGVTNSVIRSGGAITVSNSRLVGGAVNGSVTCVAVSRGATFNASGCP